MGVKFANSAFATLASSITSSSTSITLTTGQGARFPSLGGGDYFYATLIDTSNNLEIVKCTARASDVLTVVRGQEGTTARAYSTSDRIELRVTAGALVDLAGELLTKASNLSDLPNVATARSNLGLVASATTDTTNASNISSGTLALARGGSRLVKATEFVNSTRQTFSPADTVTYWSINYTKNSSTSDLYIHVLLSLYGTYNGGSYTGINIDGSVNFKGFGRATFSAESGMISMLQKRSGLASGSRTISVYQDAADNSGNYIISVFNPNSNEDARNQQNGSVMVIYEIEP